MNIQLIVPGRVKEKYIQAGVADYLSRLQRYNRAEIIEVKIKVGRSENENEEECRRLLARVPGAAFLVALDPRGTAMTSEDLAASCQGWLNSGVKNVAFLIGGPTGLSTAARQQAALLLSLSPMTFTHDMARLLLLEQLYRAFAIINGSPYHK